MKNVIRTECISVNFPPLQTAKLFTALGEVIWVPKWKPVLIKGNGFNINDIFVNSSDNNTVFIVTDYNEEQGHISYARVAPNISAATIDINIKPDENTSIVEITYNLAALNQESEEHVAQLTEEAYKAEIQQWEKYIASKDAEIKIWLENI
ncbi:hypothetical protein C4H03_RS13385 [Vibrio parahaemolyticus]|nr:hypothetical protein [Vibrio parahaemolyticus]EJG1104109.1 hypothetical protein [Vibrio parahaemolyticus]ELA6665311.1 hypothetical protein [Vibrio parahaemolyticus]